MKNQFCLRFLVLIIAIIGLLGWTLEASPGSNAVPVNKEAGSTANLSGNTGNEKNFKGPLYHQENHASPTYHKGAGNYDILLLVSDSDHPTLRSTLTAFPDINLVDYFNATAATPTLAQLLAYDAVLAWPNYVPFDSVALGNVLAAYVDKGGAVVCCGFCWYLDGNYFAGEIMSASYNPFFGKGGNWYTTANLGWHNASHPIMNGVSAVSDQYRDSLNINHGLGGHGADSVAKWSDGEWFVATMGRVVGVNAVTGDGYPWTGDLITLCHNALIWAIEQPAPTCIIFQNNNPWSLTVNQGILNSNGISYQVAGSVDIGVISLSPYNKVIIASAQPLAFYTAVATNRAWFETYINGGGILEFNGACYTSDDWTGLTMPGNFTCADQSSYTSNAVSIQLPGHPIVNIPNPITDAELDGWNYSTHSYLISFGPPFTEILRNDDYNEPCLVEFPFGNGKVIATMNTLEHGYFYGFSTILENVLLYRNPGIEEESGHPATWVSHALAQNRPNPFTNKTTISYHLASPDRVSLRIFNISGQLVKILVDGMEKAGDNTIVWDGRDSKGRDLPGGIYVCQLTAGSFKSIRKLVLMR